MDSLAVSALVTKICQAPPFPIGLPLFVLLFKAFPTATGMESAVTTRKRTLVRN